MVVGGGLADGQEEGGGEGSRGGGRGRVGGSPGDVGEAK